MSRYDIFNVNTELDIEFRDNFINLFITDELPLQYKSVK